MYLCTAPLSRFYYPETRRFINAFYYYYYYYINNIIGESLTTYPKQFWSFIRKNYNGKSWPKQLKALDPKKASGLDEIPAKVLNRNNIILPHQHGFRYGLSCETQLVEAVHD